MASKQRIDKVPKCCVSPADFLIGDILVFGLNHKHHVKKSGADVTSFAQKLMNNKGGHKDAVHVGCVILIGGEKKICHLTHRGISFDDITMIKTTTHIYRPLLYQKELGEEISAYVVENMDELKKVRWTNMISAFSFVRRIVNAIGIRETRIATLNNVKNYGTIIDIHDSEPDFVVQKHSICSKFIVDLYVAGCYRLAKKLGFHKEYLRNMLMNITSFTVPKTLQSYLYRCSNYDYLIMSNEDSRSNMCAQVFDVLYKNRIVVDDEYTGSSKSNDANAVLTDFTRCALILKRLTVLYQTKQLDKKIYLEVFNIVKMDGLYKDYFLNDLHFDNADLSYVAKSIYGYNNHVSTIYSDYRKLGFSDEEARFECEPNFCDWLGMNPRRNIVAGVFVLPFLISCVYGVWRIDAAAKLLS